MAEAPDLEDLYQTYVDQGFIVITLLSEDMSGATTDQADLEEWANQFGLTHPVVSDANYEVTTRFVDGGTIGLPSMTLLQAGAEVRYRDTWVGDSEVQANLP